MAEVESMEMREGGRGMIPKGIGHEVEVGVGAEVEIEVGGIEGKARVDLQGGRK